jgi:hypothetical protein
MANKMAPLAVNAQATTLLSPKGASEAGSKNTPEPIELPTTSATHIQKLRSCGLAGVMGQHYNVLKRALTCSNGPAFDINSETGLLPAL